MCTLGAYHIAWGAGFVHIRASRSCSGSGARLEDRLDRRTRAQVEGSFATLPQGEGGAVLEQCHSRAS